MRHLNVVLVLLICVCNVSAGPLFGDDSYRVPEAIKHHMQDRDYAKAIAEIDRIVNLKKEDESVSSEFAVDYLLYLKGRAYTFAADYDQAVTTFDDLIAKYPESKLIRKSKLARGVAFAKKGDFIEAEKAYKAEAEELVSKKRLHELATICVEYGDSYFEPTELKAKPNYAKAHKFYHQARLIGLEGQLLQKTSLRIGNCLLELKKYDLAIGEYHKFLEQHKDDDTVIEARFQLGSAQFAGKRLREARRTWEDLVQLHEKSDSPRIAEAAYRISDTFGFPAPKSKEQFVLGEAVLRRFLEGYPNHELAIEAELRIARGVAFGYVEESIDRLKKLLANPVYAKLEKRSEALFLLASIYRTQNQFDLARTTWAQYLKDYSSHSHWSKAQQGIIECDFAEAGLARIEKRYADAFRIWNKFLTDHPLDSRNPKILYQFGSMEFDQEKWTEAIGFWRELVIRYPKSRHANAAQMMIATTYEMKLKDLEKAVEEYKKVKAGNEKSIAADRISQLTTEIFDIKTSRVFRSNEQPFIDLTTRNIEKFSVGIYRINYQEYFRNNHSAGNVEALDISLIDPNHKFEFEVPDYKKHHLSEHHLNLDLPDGLKNENNTGAWIVTVSSDTQESMTLVYQSDLEIVVQTVGDDFLVYAQNMLTGAPWPKANVLLSNGGKIVAEQVTAEDGVARFQLDDDESFLRGKLFVYSEGHASSAAVRKAKSRGEVNEKNAQFYTDKPYYQPGELVHVKGILRDIVDRVGTIPKLDKLHVEVKDNQQRTIHHTSVSLGHFGSFQFNFVLPRTAALGSYQIHASSKDRDYLHHFQVRRYVVQSAHLKIETDRSVFRRGEVIKGKFKLAYYYGAPLAKKRITWQFRGINQNYSGKTDENGELEFELDTRDLSETQSLVMTAMAPDMSINAAKQFHIANSEFSVELSTQQRTVLTHEVFSVDVNTKNLAGKGVETNLRLELFRLGNEQLRKLESNAIEKKQSIDLVTDEQGNARHALTITQGGTYRIRVSGEDRFGNRVDDEISVLVSGEGDQQRLRMFADDVSAKVGETVPINIHWRENPGKALLTYSTGKIVRHEVIDLRKGNNKVELTMVPEYATQLQFSVISLTDLRPSDKEKRPNNLHQASLRFQVTPDLNIDVNVMARKDQKNFAPGEEITLNITATDGAGSPVQSELLLSMIERSIAGQNPMGRRNWLDESLVVSHDHQLFAASSCGFQYDPTTRLINEELLAEEQRQMQRQLMRQMADSQGRRQRPDSFAQRMAREKYWRTFEHGKYSDDQLGRELNVMPARTGDQLVVGENGELGQNWAVGFAGGIEWRREQNSNNDFFGLDDDQQGDFAHTFQSDAPARSNAVQGVMGGDAANRPNATPDPFSSRSVNGAGELGGFGGGGSGNQFGGRLGGVAWQQGDSREQGMMLGGAVRQDFDDLIKLIEDTMGEGEQSVRLESYPSNLSLVVTQSQSVEGAPDLKMVVRKTEFTRDQILLSADGTANVINMQSALKGEYSQAAVQKLVSSLNSKGYTVRPEIPVSETGYWNPSIFTDENGKASVTLTLPSKSTAWSLETRGFSKDILTGNSQMELTVKKGLFGQILTPTAYTDGDKTRTRVTVHNSQHKEGAIKVVLKSTIGEKTSTQSQTIEKELVGIHELTFENEIHLPEDLAKGVGANVRYELHVLHSTETEDSAAIDVVERVIPIKPDGIDVFAVAGGVSKADVTSNVSLPKTTPFSNPRLQIQLGPNLDTSLNEVLFGQVTFCQARSLRFSSNTERYTSDILAGLALRDLDTKRNAKPTPLQKQLDQRIRSAILALTTTQANDHGWAWSTGKIASNQAITARVLWALAAAQQAGYKVDEKTLKRATSFVKAKLAASALTDYEAKAMLLHALTVAGESDFTLANQLHRNRNGLSIAGLCYLTLVFAEMDRKDTASEIVKVIGERKFDESLKVVTEDSNADWKRLSNHAWNRSEVELRSLYALALESSSRDQAVLDRQIQTLMNLRRGNRWVPDKATGPATSAIASWQSRLKAPQGDYSLKITVNDQLFKELSVKANSNSQILDVPGNLLNDGHEQNVRFEIEGRGEFAYQCVLSGFVGSEFVASTTSNWSVKRHYEPANREFEGKVIDRGFSIVAGNAIAYRNELKQLPIGKRGIVTLQISRPRNIANGVDSNRDYLVVSEPLPAGTYVVENSIRGSFQSYQILPGEIQFFVGSTRGSTIEFEVFGMSQGDYRVRPTVIYNSFRQDQMAVAKSRELRVLAADEKSADDYRLSPNELYHLGLNHYQNKNYKTATEYFSSLISEWSIRPANYRTAVEALFEMELKAGNSSKIVQYFETIIEKYPNHPIPFENYLKVAQAYHEIGEYERSYLVYRGTLEASFARERTIPGFLLDEGEFEKSVAMMQGLIDQYPPESYLATARYGLAQHVYGYADNADKDKALVEAKITGETLIQRASGMLDLYLTEFPEDPAADEASFSYASTLLDLKRYDQAIDSCNRFATRFPESQFLDSFWYVTGYCHFAKGNHERAADLCNKVVEAKTIDPKTRRESESKNKWRAIYILGQIYHSLGQAKTAISYYEKVKDRFLDARQAIDYFAREDIKLKDIQTFKPDDKTAIKLDYRNIKQCRLTVYKIDLMRFSLIKRDFDKVTDINLSGIKPYHQATVKLSDLITYKDEEHQIELPLKSDGAYLVVCTHADLYTSGLVLVTPLEMEVDESPGNQRVRATIKNSKDGRYLSDVHIKAIGSSDKEFKSGETDLRGVFVADDLTGKLTIIAKNDEGNYAFYRGEQWFGPAPNAPSPRNNVNAPKQQLKSKADLLEGIKGSNRMILDKNQKQVEESYDASEGKDAEGGFGGGGFGGGGIF